MGSARGAMLACGEEMRGAGGGGGGGSLKTPQRWSVRAALSGTGAGGGREGHGVVAAGAAGGVWVRARRAQQVGLVGAAGGRPAAVLHRLAVAACVPAPPRLPAGGVKQAAGAGRNGRGVRAGVSAQRCHRQHLGLQMLNQSSSHCLTMSSLQEFT